MLKQKGENSFINVGWLVFFVQYIFHSYGDLTIAGEGLQNSDLCRLLTAFEQRGTS